MRGYGPFFAALRKQREEQADAAGAAAGGALAATQSHPQLLQPSGSGAASALPPSPFVTGIGPTNSSSSSSGGHSVFARASEPGIGIGGSAGSTSTSTGTATSSSFGLSVPLPSLPLPCQLLANLSLGLGWRLPQALGGRPSVPARGGSHGQGQGNGGGGLLRGLVEATSRHADRWTYNQLVHALGDQYCSGAAAAAAAEPARAGAAAGWDGSAAGAGDGASPARAPRRPLLRTTSTGITERGLLPSGMGGSTGPVNDQAGGVVVNASTNGAGRASGAEDAGTAGPPPLRVVHPLQLGSSYQQVAGEH